MEVEVKYKDKGKGVMYPESSGTITALVVDDEKTVRMIHQKLLNRIGVKNHAVENGKEAVDIHNTGKRFDLILMDWDMPVMDGVEATKKLRSMGIRNVIIGVSSCPTMKIQEFMDAGLDDFYMKPFNIRMLNDIVNKMQSCRSNWATDAIQASK
ncbi:two-component response regulator 24-like [Abrus precatorius]|uniref:Two-component response regulator 24-like n=1 Tax=Abrus precatorius TaxID=3816 RepID=A0A8B8KYW9_ABRPR|nr:two-component response regulator 24-like [Abrus precatorius]